jgi:hypothetical protein
VFPIFDKFCRNFPSGVGKNGKRVVLPKFPIWSGKKRQMSGFAEISQLKWEKTAKKEFCLFCLTSIFKNTFFKHCIITVPFDFKSSGKTTIAWYA